MAKAADDAEAEAAGELGGAEAVEQPWPSVEAAYKAIELRSGAPRWRSFEVAAAGGQPPQQANGPAGGGDAVVIPEQTCR